MIINVLREYGAGETPQALRAEEASRYDREPLAPGAEINRQINKAKRKYRMI